MVAFFFGWRCWAAEDRGVFWVWSGLWRSQAGQVASSLAINNLNAPNFMFGCHVLTVTSMSLKVNFKMYIYILYIFVWLPALQPPWVPWTSQIYFHRSSMAVDRVRTIGALDRPGPSFWQIHETPARLSQSSSWFLKNMWHPLTRLRQVFGFHVSDGRYEDIDTLDRQYSGQEKAYRGTQGFGETAPGHGACRWFLLLDFGYWGALASTSDPIHHSDCNVQRIWRCVCTCL